MKKIFKNIALLFVAVSMFSCDDESIFAGDTGIELVPIYAITDISINLGDNPLLNNAGINSSYSPERINFYKEKPLIVSHLSGEELFPNEVLELSNTTDDANINLAFNTLQTSTVVNVNPNTKEETTVVTNLANEYTIAYDLDEAIVTPQSAMTIVNKTEIITTRKTEDADVSGTTNTVDGNTGATIETITAIDNNGTVDDVSDDVTTITWTKNSTVVYQINISNEEVYN